MSAHSFREPYTGDPRNRVGRSSRVRAVHGHLAGLVGRDAIQTHQNGQQDLALGSKPEVLEVLEGNSPRALGQQRPVDGAARHARQEIGPGSAGGNSRRKQRTDLIAWFSSVQGSCPVRNLGRVSNSSAATGRTCWAAGPGLAAGVPRRPGFPKVAAGRENSGAVTGRAAVAGVPNTCGLAAE